MKNGREHRAPSLAWANHGERTASIFLERRQGRRGSALPSWRIRRSAGTCGELIWLRNRVPVLKVACLGLADAPREAHEAARAPASPSCRGATDLPAPRACPLARGTLGGRPRQTSGGPLPPGGSVLIAVGSVVTISNGTVSVLPISPAARSPLEFSPANRG